MLERLKRLLSRSRGVEVEYDHRQESASPVVPAGPPSAPYPPAAPLEHPVQDEAAQDN